MQRRLHSRFAALLKEEVRYKGLKFGRRRHMYILNSLFTGTVPVNKEHLISTVPVNKEHLTGTVPVNKKHLTVTIKK